MRQLWLLLAPFLALWILPAPAGAQEMLNNREAHQLLRRVSDLLEATRIVMPELSRAGAPLQENFRQGVVTLETAQRRNHTGIIYRMLLNAQAYLQLADTLPKPADFSDDIDGQLGELRRSIRQLEAHFRASLDGLEEQALGSDWDNRRRYADENRRVGPVADEGPRVVFLGDSITDAWDLNQYFPGKPYYNRGISGQITGQLLGRTKPDVIDLQAAATVVLAGTNDLARGVPDATIRSNLEAIGILAQAGGAIPIMASILPVSDYHENANPRFRRTPLRSPARIEGLNKWLEELCRSKGWPFLDYHGAMTDSSGRLREDLSDDGLHPNSEGYKVMAPLAQAAVDGALRPTVRRPRWLFR